MRHRRRGCFATCHCHRAEPQKHRVFHRLRAAIHHPRRSFAPQASVLVVTFVLFAALNALAYAFAADKLRGMIARGSVVAWITRAGGATLIAMGVLTATPEGNAMKRSSDYIRTIVDFPHEGILFRDVTTLFADPRGISHGCIDQMLHPYAGVPFDKVVGLEARGFILGGAIAHQLGWGLCLFARRANCRAP